MAAVVLNVAGGFQPLAQNDDNDVIQVPPQNPEIPVAARVIIVFTSVGLGLNALHRGYSQNAALWWTLGSAAYAQAVALTNIRVPDYRQMRNATIGALAASITGVIGGALNDLGYHNSGPVVMGLGNLAVGYYLRIATG